MRRNFSRRRLAALAAACGIAWAGGARADAADAINFTVGRSLMRDDNIFRLSDDANAPALIGTRERGDTVATTFAGVRFDRQYSRQRLSASVDARQVRYGRFALLDHDAKDLKAGWDWELGRHFFGRIAWSKSEALTDFGDFRSPVQNINTTEQRTWGVHFRLHPAWSLGANVFRVDSDNSSPLRETSRYAAEGREAVLKYTPRSGNAMALRLRRTDGHYPNRQVVAGSLVDNSFRQDEVEGSLAWHPGGASRIDARIAAVRRSHDEVPVRDFSGLTGKLAWDWTITGKTSFNVTARREIGAQEDILSSYVVTDSVSLGPTWMPTARTLVQVSIERRVRDFLGDPVASLAGIEKRQDSLSLASLAATWMPIDALQLGLTLRRERRDSNTAGIPYKAGVAFLSAQFSF
jgi:exopolysaccharide biosynthesis operon protein EpsL